MYASRAVREVCLVFAAVAVASVVLVRLGVALAMPSLAPLGVALVFLSTALGMADRRGGAERFGIALGGLLAARPSASDVPSDEADRMARAKASARSTLEETWVAFLASALTFPVFVIGYIAWFRLDGRLSVSVPTDFASLVLTQIVLVALPEEAFFRGYVQTRLSDAWPATRPFLGALVSPRVLFLQAALFAILHFVVEPLPDRLAVFFPALLFGWLRARRGGIGAALLFHASCNVYSELLYRSLT